MTIRIEQNDEWPTYYADLEIPANWVDVSYGNDELPSFHSEIDELKAYQVWIGSPNDRESDRLPRFCVSLCYGSDCGDFFQSDSFEDVLQWIKDNPKTEEQIELTKEYV